VDIGARPAARAAVTAATVTAARAADMPAARAAATQAVQAMLAAETAAVRVPAVSGANGAVPRTEAAHRTVRRELTAADRRHRDPERAHPAERKPTNAKKTI